jgi:anaerobic ribonucleoside-triphosphate reductase activating protein
MNKLKYLGYSIVFQEVPDEVTLAINISGCPHKCEGCHSKYLWEYEGNYISDDLESLIEKYKGLITCVCFMGGDQNQQELLELLIKVHQYKLKTALYTGADFLSCLSIRILGNLDYCKIGHYDQIHGGLNNTNTNQRMLKWNWNTNRWDDITYKFQKGYHNG